MIEVLYFDEVERTEKILSANDRKAAEHILAVKSYCHCRFYAFLVPARNLVRFQELRQLDGQRNLTDAENAEYDSLYIGSAVHRRTSNGAKGVRTPHWKWNAMPRWTMV